MNFNLLDPNCQKSILISEDYCLDKSFDIIKNNFELFSKELNLSNDQFKRFEILKNRFEENKQKYQKYLTFVSQFSASLENVQNIYNTYKNIWEANTTPLEVIYPTFVPVSEWGDFNEKNGVLTEITSISNTSIKSITNWVNGKFSTERFGLYKNLVVRVYITKNIPNNFEVSASFKEDCDCQGGTHEVCCSKPCTHGGHKGCNKMPKGNKCGNMFSLCPAGVLLNRGCIKTTCFGWGSGFTQQTWKGKTLSIKRSINSVESNYIVGFSKINFKISTKQLWERG